MIVTIENTFHGTTTTVDVPPTGRRLSRAEVRQVESDLCGMADCCCEKVVPGERQDCVWDLRPGASLPTVRPLS